jgi:hypothetical protein
VDYRWHSIKDREKVSPKSFGIRIRDPASFKIPIEVTGCGKVNSHMHIGDSAHQVLGVDNSKYMTS